MFTGIIKKVSRVESIRKTGGGFFVSVKKPTGWKIERGESISINGICSTVRSISKNNFQVEYMPETLKKTTAGGFKKGTKVNLEKSLRVGDLVGGHFVQGHIDGVGKVMKIHKVRKSKVIKISISEKFIPHLLQYPACSHWGKQNKFLAQKPIHYLKGAGFVRFIAPKGSIAVDGVSLTVVDVGKNWFTTTPFQKVSAKKLLKNNKSSKQKEGDSRLKKVWWFTVSLVSYTLENTNLDDLKVGDKVNVETDVLAKYLMSLRGARRGRRSNPGEPN